MFSVLEVIPLLLALDARDLVRTTRRRNTDGKLIAIRTNGCDAC